MAKDSANLRFASAEPNITFTRINGYLVPLEHYESKPSAWAIFVCAISIFAFAVGMIFLMLAQYVSGR